MSAFSQRYMNQADPLRTERRVELAVLVLVVLLLLQILWGAYRALFPAVPEPFMPAPESLRVGALNDGASLTAESRAEIRERPVFWVSRKALGPGERAASGEDPAPGGGDKKPREISGVKLSGVFGAGDAAGIIVLVDGTKRRIMVGEEMNGWTLDAVTPVEAMFSDGGRQASLALKRGKLPVSELAAESPAADDSANPPAGNAGEEVPDTLGLGGGDRNRGKKTKQK